jgi:hypothetical protein
MTDAPAPQRDGKTMKQKFAEGLRELIELCLDGNMHPSEMIEALEAELKWARQPFGRADRSE